MSRVRISAAVQSRPFDIAQPCKTRSPCTARAGCARPRSFTRACSRPRREISTRCICSACVKAQSGQMGEAYRLMAAALKINAQAPDAWINFANVLHALKRDDEALDALDKALALRPGDADALHNRGNALLALGAHAGGARLFRRGAGAQSAPWRGAARPRHRARQRSGEPPTRSPISTPRWRSRPAIRARSIIAATRCSISAATPRRSPPSMRALSAAPATRKAWNNRGRALQALNRHAEAVASFDKAIALAKGLRRRPFQPRAVAAHARRLRARLCRIRMALEAQRHDRHAPRLSRRALARRISAGAQDASCCTPNRASATPFSLRATCRCSRACRRHRACWKCSRN